MIIKKPYIFLIKHFRKIHIFLLIMGIFIYFKHTSLVSFIKDFMEYSAYDVSTNPVSKYIPFWYIILILIMGLLSLALLVLLKEKRKPWKLYLIPTVTYLIMFLLDVLLRSYFVGYNGGLDRASVALYRDLAYLTLVTQIPIFIVYLMRVLGLNLKKFDFKLDEEYLEIAEEDKEDLEININIDKEGIFRVLRRLWRNIGYVYQEHKLIFNSIFTIIGIIILYRTYVFIFITNKSYKQNDTYDINGYSIIVKDSYYTNKDGKGEVIEKDKGFVIVNINVKNNAERRKFNYENFHIINGISKGEYTKTYELSFDDLGKMDDNLEIKRDGSKNTMLVFKVDSKLNKNRFVLYYQEKGGDYHLRKIKLKIKDLSKINIHDNMKIGDSFKSTIYKKEEEMSVDSVDITNEINYDRLVCSSYNDCSTEGKIKQAPKDKSFLVLEFGTEEIEGDDLINICTKYGEIEYAAGNKTKTIPVKNALSEKYLGKYAYIEIPDEVSDSKSIKFALTIRNNKYVYKIR